MVYELLHAPMPNGYSDALLPLAQCRQHLSLEADDESQDLLVAAFRDAAIEFVERYCSVRMGPMEGLVWRAERFPCGTYDPLSLGVSPVTAITAVTWLDGSGGATTGAPGDYRVGALGDVLPAYGQTWPTSVSGGVSITFSAGFAADACPRSLLAAARMMLAHFWEHREAVLSGTIEAEVSFGVKALCAPFRRVLI